MKVITLSIPNFNKYNPRQDRPRHSWFRLENTIFSSEDLYGLSPDQKWVWICLLCLASKKQSDILEVQIDWLADVAKLPRRLILETIEDLLERGLVSSMSPHGYQATPDGSPTNKQTDITIQTNNIAQFALSETDLEDLYFLYPRRVGKTAGLKKLKKDLKSLHDVEDFKKAVAKYKAEIESKGTEPKFIKHFNSFVNQWREWLDPETGSTTIDSSKNFDPMTAPLRGT